MTGVFSEDAMGVPEGWTQTNLGNYEFFDLIMGQSPSSETYTAKKTGLPFLQGNADFGVINPNPKTYCTEPMKVAEKDDILISVRAPVGEVNIATERYCIDRGLGAIRPKDKHDSKYLYYYLNHYRHNLERISAGSTFKAITKDDLEKFSVTLPPSEEKQKIISILTTVDDAIQRSRQAAAETERLKGGVMQELMTKGIGHMEFKDDPDVGMVPKEWDIAQLGKFIDFQPGYAFKSEDYQNRGIKLFKISNVAVGKTAWDDISYLPDSFRPEFSDFLLKQGDIVMAMTRPVISDGIKITKIQKEDCPCFLNQRVGRFIIKNGLDEDYLFQILSSGSFIKSIISGSLGSQQPNISSKQIERIVIPVPKISEQRSIANILRTTDRKLSLQHQRTAHYEHLKQGLMSELLTGKRRVKVT